MMKRSDVILSDEHSHSGDESAARQLGGLSVCALTAAEKRILACVSLAKTNKEIAGELNISPATVKRHVENILRKLGLRNRVEAAIFALLLGGCTGETRSGCALRRWWNERLEPNRASILSSWAI